MRGEGLGDSKVKLSCRNLWKIYGDSPDKFFKKSNGVVPDPVSLTEEIGKSGHIVANANISFDVHVGEIFVIMGLSGTGKSSKGCLEFT